MTKQEIDLPHITKTDTNLKSLLANKWQKGWTQQNKNQQGHGKGF